MGLVKVMLAQGSFGGEWEFVAVIFHPESKCFPTCIKHTVSSAECPGMHCPLSRQQLLSGKSKWCPSLNVAGLGVSVEK